MAFDDAVAQLRDGRPILLYDDAGREAETDIVLPAEAVTWEDVRFLRNEAGGLICVAVPYGVAERFDLPLLTEVFDGFDSDPDYDDRSSFSISVNHVSTYTGVTDRDRATTIQKLADAVADDAFPFRDEFRAPGHVPLLVAADGGLAERQGHTELAVTLLERAGVTPAAVVCEMLDDESGDALPRDAAERYAERNDLAFLEGSAVES